MKLKNPASLLLGLGLAIVLSVPAFADTMNARLKSVDTTANTITVTERKVDYTITVNGDTHYLNAAGSDLAGGLSSGDLKPGARLAITYTKTDDKSVASEIKLRPAMKKAPAAAPAPAPAPANP